MKKPIGLFVLAAVAVLCAAPSFAQNNGQPPQSAPAEMKGKPGYAEFNKLAKMFSSKESEPATEADLKDKRLKGKAFSNDGNRVINELPVALSWANGGADCYAPSIVLPRDSSSSGKDKKRCSDMKQSDLGLVVSQYKVGIFVDSNMQEAYDVWKVNAYTYRKYKGDIIVFGKRESDYTQLYAYFPSSK